MSERERYNYYMNNLPELESALQVGAKRAADVANVVLERVRLKLGFQKPQCYFLQ